MPLLIVSNKYNGIEGNLSENAGDWADGEALFISRVSAGSGTSNAFTYSSIGGIYRITRADGNDWGDYGFVAGQNIVLREASVPDEANVVSSIDGATLYLVNSYTQYPDPTTFPNPALGIAGLSVFSTDVSEQIDFFFNLSPNTSNTVESVIDNEVNKFSISGTALTGLVPAGTAPMVQQGNQSGGLIKNVALEFQGIFDDYFRYKVTFKFWDWGVIQDGVAEPSYYNGTENLKPVIKLDALAQIGNSNGILTSTTALEDANTGGYDENYNQGVDNYIVQSISWLDYLGNPISAMDYSNWCSFTAIVTAPNQSQVTSEYYLGLVFRPEDTTIYKNLPESIGNNLLLNAPEVAFPHSLIPDGATHLGYANSNGVQIDFTGIHFELSGSTLTIKANVEPNAAAKAYFDSIPDGGRKITLWASMGSDAALVPSSDRVSKKLFDEDCIDAPTLGIEYPYVVDKIITDHGLRDITNAVTVITTEDDVLYESTFRLEEGIEYEGVRTRIYMKNDTTNEEFDLEDTFFSFASTPFVGGIYQFAETINRGFGLPPSSDRNLIKLERNALVDIVNFYGMKLDYGFLSRWEYWLAQNNVDNDFYDVNLPNNGKNKNWQTYSADPDWQLMISYYVRKDGVDDYVDQDIDVRPYDDEDVTTVVTYTRSDGSNPTSLVSNEVFEVEAVLTWNTGLFDALDNWEEVTVEDFESGNRWVLSSLLDQGNVNANPLKPIIGATKLDVSIVGNVATLKYLIDTNVIGANSVSLGYRIFSNESLPVGAKITEDDLPKDTENDLQKLIE